MPSLHPEAQARLERILASGEKPMETMTPQEARAIADARVLQGSFAVRKNITAKDARAGSVPIRIYRPAKESGAVLVYIHGGGMVLGSLETVDPHCRVFADELGCTVVSIGYRLAPEHRFPAGAEDAIAAVKWLQDNAASLGFDAGRMALAGESSGGTLVAAACQHLRDAGRPRPRGQIMIYPVLDSGTQADSFRRFADGYFLTKKKWQWFANHYLRTAADERDPLASPLRAARFDGLPPALIVTAELDPLVDDAAAYAGKLKAAGVPVDYRCLEGWPHGFFYWAETVAAQETMALCIDAVRRWTTT